MRRSQLERHLLAGIRERLLAPEVVSDVHRRVRQRLRELRKTPRRETIPKLEAEVARLVEAVALGTFSPSLRARLEAAETRLAEARAQTNDEVPSSQELLAGLTDRYRTLVDDLAQSLRSTDAARARTALRDILGEIRVEIGEREVRFIAQGTEEQTTLANVSGGSLQLNLVAGARFCAYRLEVELR